MASRNCSYCGKELTDAASKNHGIGPVCRKMQNHVLAQLIPADVALAQYVYGRVVSGTPLCEEVAKTLHAVGSDLKVTDNKDWRKTCNRIEFALSFTTSSTLRNGLIDIVAALGYVSLASLLSGEAAKSLATITFENGRLFVKGPRNKAGHTSLKAIKGRKFHASTKRWSVPAAAHAEFQTTIWKHWPKNEGLQEALTAAENHAIVAEAVEVEAPVAEKAPTVVLTKEGAFIKIASPYNKAFIAALKTEVKAWKERRWNPSEKVWEVLDTHAELVTTLIATHYGEQVAL